jgi:hypothetical protein
VTSLVLPNFTPGSRVYLNVSAYNTDGVESDLSDTVTYKVPAGVLVTWSASAKAVSNYRLSYGKLNQTATSFNAGLSLSHLVTNLTAGATYYFYAQGLNSSGAVVEDYLQKTYTVPTTGARGEVRLAPENIKPSVSLSAPLAGATLVTGKAASLKATASDSDGSVTRVDFYAGTTKIASSTSPFSASWTPATAGSYQLSAVAYDNDGASTRSSYVTVTVKTGPTAPSTLSVAAQSGSSIRLTWTDRATTESGFYVYRAVGTGSFTRIKTLAANSVSFTDSGLTAGTKYSYRVTAYNAVGESAAASGSTTTPSGLPPAPSSFKAVPQWTGGIKLTWSPTGNEAGFYLYRAVNGGTYNLIATIAGNAVSYLDDSLAPATRYNYRLITFTAAGNSPAATASATTLDIP